MGFLLPSCRHLVLCEQCPELQMGSRCGCSTACSIQSAFDWEHTRYASAELISAADQACFWCCYVFFCCSMRRM